MAGIKDAVTEIGRKLGIIRTVIERPAVQSVEIKNAIALAGESLAEIAARVEALGARRRDLLVDGDRAAVAAIDAELRDLEFGRERATALRERLEPQLVAAEAAEEVEALRQFGRERAALIGRVAKKIEAEFGPAIAKVRECQNLIAGARRAYAEAVNKQQTIDAERRRRDEPTIADLDVEWPDSLISASSEIEAFGDQFIEAHKLKVWRARNGRV